MTIERAASRTAVLVCQGRAAADGRLARDVFSDPVAYELLTPQERTAVDRVRASMVPSGWAPRFGYESVHACTEIMVPRTVAIDDAIRYHPHRQLVILGAGLDSRAWRMSELADVDVTEIDHPASQADKRARVGTRRPLARAFRYLPVDFATDDLGRALEAGGHDPDVPTTWVWEGVIPYLTRSDIVATLNAVGGRSARGSTLVVNYQTPSLRARAGRVMVAVLARLGSTAPVTSGEPWRTLLTPAQAARLLADAGFGIETDDDLLEIAGRIGLTTQRVTSLTNGRVAVATRR